MTPITAAVRLIVARTWLPVSVTSGGAHIKDEVPGSRSWTTVGLMAVAACSLAFTGAG